MLYDHLGKILIILSIIFLILGGVIQKHRQDYLNQHCTIIGEMASSVGIGQVATGNGVGVGPVYIPSKTGYACDDGQQYWE